MSDGPALKSSLSSVRFTYRQTWAITAASVLVAAVLARPLQSIRLFVLSPLLLALVGLFWLAVGVGTLWFVDRRTWDSAYRHDAVKSRPRAPSSERAEPAHAPRAPAAGADQAPRKRLKFTSPAAWSALKTKESWGSDELRPTQRLSSRDAHYELSKAVESFLQLITRDFIQTWYKNISRSPLFPNAVKDLVRQSLTTLGTELDRVDWSEVLVGRIIPLVTEHVETFTQAENALRGQGSKADLTESDELDLFLASKYASLAAGGKLHAAVDVASPNTKPSEEAWLRSFVAKLLPHVLPAKDAESKAVSIVAREIVACAILLPVIEMLTDPDFWNRLIDVKAGAAIQEQMMVTQFREALDEQGSAVNLATLSKAVHGSAGSATAAKDEISTNTSQKQFEAFVRGIGKCKTLLEARRIRNDVTSQIQKTRLLIGSRGPTEIVDGQRVSDLHAHVNRLQLAKGKAEARISELSGQQAERRVASLDSAQDHSSRRITLSDVISQPASLSYFMEFQDRRHRSYRVQFWLMIEGIKEPLEDVTLEDRDSQILVSMSDARARTTKEDLEMVWTAYLSSDVLGSDPRHLRTVKAFLDTDSTTTVALKDVRRVRQAVFAMQRDVFIEMEEEDFPEFESTELFFKAAAAIPEGPQTSATTSPGMTVRTRPRASSHPDFDSGLRQSSPSPTRSPTRSTTPNSTKRPLSLMRIESSDRVTSRRQDVDQEDRAPPSKSHHREAVAFLLGSSSSPAGSLFGDEGGDDRPRKPVFDDEEAELEDEPSVVEQPEEADHDEHDGVRLAAPGDLQLPLEIAKLNAAITKLQEQEVLVDALIRKAELTGRASELRILNKSKDSLQRERRSMSFQKEQYETQESQNQLQPNKTSVAISGTTVGQGNGHNYQMYLIEVHKLADDGAFASGWIVTRRYSEFATLHAVLKERFAFARTLEFPGKKLVTSLNDIFVEQRKNGLEAYLKALVSYPPTCQSSELHEFLSQRNITLPNLRDDASRKQPSSPSSSIFPGQSIARSFYRTLTSGIEDIVGGSPASMMDAVTQRLLQQASDFTGLSGLAFQDEDVVGQLSAARLAAGNTALPGADLGQTEVLSYFTAPICDLCITLFDLKENNNWLRRQAILIILQQLLGGTIERKLRDGIKALSGPDQLAQYIGVLKDNLWPNGSLKPKLPPRSDNEKSITRASAHRKLSKLMPDVAASLIGRSNARRAARKLFAILQNRRLNKHLVYMLVEEVVHIVIPALENETMSTPQL